MLQRVTNSLPSRNLSRLGIIPITDPRFIFIPQTILRQQHKVVIRPTETGLTLHLIVYSRCRLHDLIQILQHRIETINPFPNRSPSP